MTILLYNHTRYDSKLLRSILRFAARCAGVRSVPVKITYSRHLCAAAEAYSEYPYVGTLSGKPRSNHTRRERLTFPACPVGWIKMSLPRELVPPSENPAHVWSLSTQAACWFVNTTIHEMAHIRQYRKGAKGQEFYGVVSGRKRRIRHESRPCEVDAENLVFDVQHNSSRNRRRLALVDLLALELTLKNLSLPPPIGAGKF